MSSELPPIIQQLIRDHRNMARLLDVLGEELEQYKDGKAVDFEVLSRILDYVLNFPELRHHPREDLIFRHLKQRDPASAREAESIMSAHKELAALTRKLSAALRNLHQGAEMSRPWFETLVDDYLAKNREHMRKEEQTYFPLAVKVLDPADWHRIEAEATKGGHDPLFDGKIDSEYQALHDRILRLAR